MLATRPPIPFKTLAAGASSLSCAQLLRRDELQATPAPWAQQILNISMIHPVCIVHVFARLGLDSQLDQINEQITLLLELAITPSASFSHGLDARFQSSCGHAEAATFASPGQY